MAQGARERLSVDAVADGAAQASAPLATLHRPAPDMRWVSPPRSSAELAGDAGPQRLHLRALGVEDAADAAHLEFGPEAAFLVDPRAAEHAARCPDGEAAGGAQMRVGAAE